MKEEDKDLGDDDVLQQNVSMDKNERVKSSLFGFLQSHLAQLREEEIDDIVLDYVVNIVEDVASSSSGDADFDVAEFCEMLTAYMPQTADIAPEVVAEWMFKLADEMRELERAKACKFDIDLSSVIEETARRAAVPARSPKTSESSDGMSAAADNKKRLNRYSENSDGGSSDSSGLDGDEFQAKLNQLLEMFPDTCNLEVSHCLNLMAGDIEEAAQMIIQRQENGQSLQQKRSTTLSAHKPKVDEKDLRKRIVHQYGFVDQEEDMRYHRPTVRRGDEKKLIRYRDNKIVSTKGERFSQVTKEESEEMKKSYVS